MKKTLTIICAIALVMGLATASFAAWDNWIFQMKACDTNFSSAAPNATFGSIPGGTDGYKSGEDVALGTVTGAIAKLAIYQPSWPITTVQNYLYKTDKRGNDYSDGNPKVWNDIVVWASNTYSADKIRVSYAIPTAVPVDMGTDPDGAGPLPGTVGLNSFKITVINDPTGTYEAGTVLLDWEYGSGLKSGGSMAAGSAGLGYFDFGGVTGTPGVSAVKFLDDADAQTGGIRLRLEVVPEPSSLLALASGLAGLAGLALKRRA